MDRINRINLRVLFTVQMKHGYGDWVELSVSQGKMVPMTYHGIIWSQSDSDTVLSVTERWGLLLCMNMHCFVKGIERRLSS